MKVPLMSEPEKPVYQAEQKNKRRTTRAPLIVEKIPCEDGRKTFFGYAKDLSRGGMFIATVKPREPGEEFTIELTLPRPSDFTLRCRCQVVWKRHFERNGRYEPGMGLRFLDLPQEDGERIDVWVTERTTRQSE